MLVRLWYSPLRINIWRQTVQRKDGDTVMTTPNELIMQGVEQLPPIICMQNSAEKIIPTEEDLAKSNKNGFDEKIGSYTNKATTMEQMLCKFEKGSEEHKELNKRIRLCMHFQQAEIDKIKGIEAPKMPKEWFDYKVNKPSDDDTQEEIKRKEFNIRILANKKPKFMIYIYDDLMKEYKKFKDVAYNSSIMQFKVSPEVLKDKKNKTEDEIEFLEKIEMQCPVEQCNSLMNKICIAFEKEFDDIVKTKESKTPFDYSFLVSDKLYSKSRKNKIENLYKDYIKRVRSFMKESSELDDDFKKDSRIQMLNHFRQQCYEVCSDSSELMSILVEMLYNTSKSKQFVWDICGEDIIDNLLKINDYTINYPIKDENGDIEYSYERYSMKKLKLSQEVV